MTHSQPAHPGTDQPTETTPTATGWRFTNHYRPTPNPAERGPWCPWSFVTVTEKLANSDDRHCLYDCPTSNIEAVPTPRYES